MRWIRPVISIAFTGTLIYGFVVRLIPQEIFTPVAVGAIVWWYRDRQKTKDAEVVQNIANANAQAVIAQAIDTKGQT